VCVATAVSWFCGRCGYVASLSFGETLSRGKIKEDEEEEEEERNPKETCDNMASLPCVFWALGTLVKRVLRVVGMLVNIPQSL